MFGTSLSTGTISSTIHLAIASRKSLLAGLRSANSMALTRVSGEAFLGKKSAIAARSCFGVSPSSLSMADGPGIGSPALFTIVQRERVHRDLSHRQKHARSLDFAAGSQTHRLSSTVLANFLTIATAQSPCWVRCGIHPVERNMESFDPGPCTVRVQTLDQKRSPAAV